MEWEDRERNIIFICATSKSVDERTGFLLGNVQGAMSDCLPAINQLYVYYSMVLFVNQWLFSVAFAEILFVLRLANLRAGGFKSFNAANVTALHAQILLQITIEFNFHSRNVIWFTAK